MATPDLVGYLRARLDEEEMLAIAAPRGPWLIRPGKHDGYPQTIMGGGGCPVLVGTTYDGPVDGTGLRRSPSTAQHITYWHPGRVLADIAAKRAVVEQWERAMAWTHTAAGATAGYAEVVMRDAALALAQPYASRPDSNPEWVTP